MKFVVRNTSRGWEIEACKLLREGSRYWLTTKLQWRQQPEALNENFIFKDYDEAERELEKRKAEK